MLLDGEVMNVRDVMKVRLIYMNEMTESDWARKTLHTLLDDYGIQWVLEYMSEYAQDYATLNNMPEVEGKFHRIQAELVQLRRKLWGWM